MNIVSLQQGIFQWFCASPAEFRTMSAIDAVCTQLWGQNQAELSNKRAKYNLFFPLLRCGALEFYGSNHYAIAPSVIQENDSHVLFVNVPNKNFLFLEDNPFFLQFGFRVYRRSKPITDFVRFQNIPISNFSILQCLTQLPSLYQIVNLWPSQDPIGDGDYYYFTNEGLWATTKPLLPGIYKKSKEIYAQRFLYDGTNGWRVIPRSDQQPDAFSLAILWSQLNGACDLRIIYYKNLQQLEINTPFFPILLERFLAIQSLLMGNLPLKLTGRRYYISHNDFHQLNFFFDNRITLI